MTEALRQETQQFFDRFGGVDEEVVEYLAGVLSGLDDDTDPEDIRETVCGFCPVFEALPVEEQTDLVLGFVAGAHAIVRDRSAAGAAPPPPSLPGRGADANPALSSLSLTDEDRRVAATTGTSGGEAIGHFSCTLDAETLQSQKELQLLAGLCGAEGVDHSFLNHLLNQMCSNNIEQAAQWILDNDVSAEQKKWKISMEESRKLQEAEKESTRKQNKAITQRFQYQFVASTSADRKKKGGKRGEPQLWIPAVKNDENSKNGVRYHDNMVVSRKGEKYIVEKTTEEWDGGSTGKVYTKGKRGKGYV